ncbi:MAG: hypothetical protein OEN56_09645 [Gemmatimonadota bacterium]|nr:hypothetical protein [Gemmatimonadota bacterium]
MKSLSARVGGILTLAAGIAVPASAQYSIGTGVDYLGFSFDDGLGAGAAQLVMIPVAVRLPVNDRLSFDLFSAYADGRIEQNGSSLTLSGPIDTSIKASYQATPWAIVSVGAKIPTGDGTHTGQEALVASVLSTDLLGFRESTWGTGFAVTSSVGVARKVGAFGLGIAAAYAARGSFEPSEGVSLSYQPGNEVRIRAGIDRNFANSTLTLGATFIDYAQDRVTDDIASDRNLFQAGNRIRLDASYAFRAGGGVWTVYGAGLLRENGDLRVDIVDETSTPIDSAFVQTAKQNLIMGGVIGTIGLGGGFVFRPHVDYRLQSREEANGADAGSGWILAAGGDIPLRLFGTEFFPKARVHFGAIRSLTGEDVSLLGMEFKGTIRVRF